MNIKSIIILKRRATDRVMLVTDLMDGTFPWQDNAIFTTEVSHGEGESWVAHNFPGTEVTIINGSS